MYFIIGYLIYLLLLFVVGLIHNLVITLDQLIDQLVLLNPLVRFLPLQLLAYRVEQVERMTQYIHVIVHIVLVLNGKQP
jgi:hypothetical protein